MTEDERGADGDTDRDADRVDGHGGRAEERRAEASSSPPKEQKARAGMKPTDEQVATYRFARAFLFAEWGGALLMAASFIQLYVFVPLGVSTRATVAAGLVLLGLGTWMFWSNRQHYLRLEFPWRRRWEVAATVVAGSGGLFWLLFVFLGVLTVFGYDIT